MEEADLPFASETGRRVCGGRGKKGARADPVPPILVTSPPSRKALTIRGRRRKG